VTTKDEPTERTRAAVAKEFGVPERKLRDMQEISKHSPAAVAAIRGEPRHYRARRAIRPRRGRAPRRRLETIIRLRYTVQIEIGVIRFRNPAARLDRVAMLKCVPHAILEQKHPYSGLIAHRV